MSNIDTIYECTPRQIAEFIEDCFYEGLVPNVLSSPGMGKSSIFSGVFKKLRLWKIDHRASTSDPTDFTGLPGFENGKAKFMPFEEIFPIETTPVPDRYDGFGIFLDEYNTAGKSIQAAGYKLVLDRMVGQHKLHPNSVIGMAGNLSTDGAITNRMGTAMQSRVITLRMRTDFKEWLEDVAVPMGYDHRIIAYLSWKPASLNNFKPDHPGDNFACQRTWEFMNNSINGKPILDRKIPKYVGTIGAGEAVSFVQFSKVYENIPDIHSVVNDPTGINVPADAATRWAVVSMLASLVADDTLNQVCRYIDRFGIEGKLLFYRSALAKNPTFHGHPAITTALVNLSSYINNTDRQLGAFAKAA